MSLQLISVLILGVVMFLCVPALLHADATSRKNASGNRLYKEGKYDEAAKKYLDAQLESPKSSGLSYNLGNADYKLKKYEKALENYRKAGESTDPKMEQRARYNLGNALYKMGEFEVNQGKQEGLAKLEQAIEAYKRALDLDPNDKDAKYNLEFVRRKLKEMSKRDPQQQKQEQQQQKDQKQQQQQEQDERKKQEEEENQRQQQQQQQQQGQDSSAQRKPKPGEMPKEQAERLLDAFKDSEKESKENQTNKRPGRVWTDKDW